MAPGIMNTRARFALVSIVILALVGAIVAGAVALANYGGGPAKATVAGTLLNRPVPSVTLVDQHGRKLTLDAFRGRVVVLAPFLTLCHESCPLTTGAFEQMQREVKQAGLAQQVMFVEVSVDPWRDNPQRLHAFAQLAGIHYTLLTGTLQNLTRLWHFFGVSFFRQPEGKPPDTDWLTGKPLTFDVIHTDALFLIDKQGHERIVDGGMADVDALPATLKRLLSAEGRHDLAHPTPGWTITDATHDIDYLLSTNLLDPSQQ
jgi:protein SCO1/2